MLNLKSIRMRKTFTYLSILLSSVIITGGQYLQAQKTNPANLAHTTKISHSTLPAKGMPLLKSKSKINPVSKIAFLENDTVIDNNGFLQGQYVEVGISNCGCFGTTSQQPAGYHGNINSYLGFVADPAKDGWDVGNPLYNGDYFLPGSPEEGWGVEIDGNNYGNFSQCEENNIPGAVTSVNLVDGQHNATWKGDLDGLSIEQVVSFHDTGTFFVISATLTNKTSETLKNLYYMRNVDPDNENVATGEYTTKNKIEYQPYDNTCKKALVSGTGLDYGMYLGLGTADERARVTYGGFSNRVASDVWSGTEELIQVDSATDDIAISLSFKLGDLKPGESTTVIYTYVLDASQIDNAINAVVRLRANGEDITNTLIHSNCDRPVDLEVTNSSGYTWTWSPATHLSATSGNHVIFTAPVGSYNCSVTGVGECGDVTFNFSINIQTDAENPVVIAKPTLKAALNENDSLYLKVSDINDGSFDNCHLDTLFLSRYLITIADTGIVIPIILTGRDDNGFESKDTCELTILTKQDFIDAIVAQIILMADNNDASELTIKMLTDIGITGVVKSYLNDYKNAINNGVTITNLADIQTFVTQTNALTVIRKMSDNEDASGLTISMLTDLGIAEAIPENLKFYRTFIEWGVWWVSEIENAVAMGNSLGEINQMAIDNDASTLDINKLWDLDFNANEDNLEFYKSGIASKDSINSWDFLQDLLYQMDAFAQIVEMAQTNDASGLDEYILTQVGVELVINDFMSIYQDSIAAADTFSSPLEIQQLIASINAQSAFLLIQEMAVNDDASGLTIDLLTAAGILRHKPQYLLDYQDVIVAADLIQSVPELQSMIDGANAMAAFTIIQNMAYIKDASELSIDLLAEATITSALNKNLIFYKASVQNADTIIAVENLQLLIDVDNAWVSLGEMTYTNNASSLTIAMLELLGANVSSENLAFYKTFVAASDTIEETTPALQIVVYKADMLSILNGMAVSGEVSNLTADMLTLPGGNGVIGANLYAYKLYLAAASEVITVTELQDIIDAANAYAQIMTMFTNGNTDALTIQMLINAGILHTQGGKLSAYKSAIKDAGSISDLAALQAIIDGVNSATDLDITSADGLKIYPVPATSYLFIEGSFESARLLSIDGKIIINLNMGSNITSINIGGIKTGIYILETIKENKISQFMVVKE
jgi:hypothetical protein